MTFSPKRNKHPYGKVSGFDRSSASSIHFHLDPFHAHWVGKASYSYPCRRLCLYFLSFDSLSLFLLTTRADSTTALRVDNLCEDIKFLYLGNSLSSIILALDSFDKFMLEENYVRRMDFFSYSIAIISL